MQRGSRVTPGGGNVKDEKINRSPTESDVTIKRQSNNYFNS